MTRLRLPITRDRHADGVHVPRVWASGRCYRGHDITIEPNVQLHDRRSDGNGFAVRCGQCKRETQQKRAEIVLTNVTAKICGECGEEFLPTGAAGLAAWATRKYCSGPCGRRAAARRNQSRSSIGVSVLGVLKPRDGWQQRASCYDADLERDEFYGYDGENIDELAKRTVPDWCWPCPVRRECLLFAVATGEKWGIWGGMTPTQRDEYAAQLRRQRRNERRRASAAVGGGG